MVNINLHYQAPRVWTKEPAGRRFSDFPPAGEMSALWGLGSKSTPSRGGRERRRGLPGGGGAAPGSGGTRLATGTGSPAPTPNRRRPRGRVLDLPPPPPPRPEQGIPAGRPLRSPISGRPLARLPGGGTRPQPPTRDSSDAGSGLLHRVRVPRGRPATPTPSRLRGAPSGHRHPGLAPPSPGPGRVEPGRLEPRGARQRPLAPRARPMAGSPPCAPAAAARPPPEALPCPDGAHRPSRGLPRGRSGAGSSPRLCPPASVASARSVAAAATTRETFLAFSQPTFEREQR
ncbi:translation initiation factor IF-2-like [Prionailurus viverrinus]|uniref:translation initiation factor IF-2-like n=1 Tax=Prionailurus viverrinus TaxID=61388 RepID=UPI001FF3BB63|nr:translation initiation factor IF-2-like [Prionailurus viverrinus]